VILTSKLSINIETPKVGELYRILDVIKAPSNLIVLLENVYNENENWQDFLQEPDNDFMLISDASAESLRLEFES